MPTITSKELLGISGLKPHGPVRWGTPITATGPGVYIVEWPTSITTAPVHEPAIKRWLDKVRDLRMDGARPTPADLTSRLATFWVPHQTIIYIGQTSLHIGGRIRQYYETDLGDRRPHSGGMWLKALEGFDQAWVWWAPSTEPIEKEADLLRTFATRLDATPFPFANLVRGDASDPNGRRRERKPHGLSRQRARA